MILRSHPENNRQVFPGGYIFFIYIVYVQASPFLSILGLVYVIHTYSTGLGCALKYQNMHNQCLCCRHVHILGKSKSTSISFPTATGLSQILEPQDPMVGNLTSRSRKSPSFRTVNRHIVIFTVVFVLDHALYVK